MYVCLRRSSSSSWSRVRFRYPAIYGNEFRSRVQPTSVHCVHYVQAIYGVPRYTTSRKLRTVSCHVTIGKNFRAAVIEIAPLYIAIGCRTKVSIICIFAKSCKKSTSQEHYVHRFYYRQKWSFNNLISVFMRKL